MKDIRNEVQELVWSGMDRSAVYEQLRLKHQYYDKEIQKLIAFTPSKKDKESIAGLNQVLVFLMVFWGGAID